jgi:phage terminase large subunit GpA-like protein
MMVSCNCGFPFASSEVRIIKTEEWIEGDWIKFTVHCPHCDDEIDIQFLRQVNDTIIQL